MAERKGNPAILGLDIIWNLEKDDDSYAGGKILDPKKGKVYGCEIWKEGDKLIVRGKIAFLGRNQTWLPNTEFKPADNTALTPLVLVRIQVSQPKQISHLLRWLFSIYFRINLFNL